MVDESNLLEMNALEVNGLHMRFGPVVALAGLSIGILRGEIHGIVGHNGSGKSTLIEILAGTHTPTSGALKLFGDEEQFPATSRNRSKYPLAVVHQDVGLVGSLSIVDNFRVNRFSKSRLGTIRWRDEIKLTRQRLLALGVNIDPKELVQNLSAADQVLISVARALMDLELIRQNTFRGDRSILILDEPTSSLPTGTIESFLQTIRELNEQLGTTVVLVSHNPREIMALSHRFSALKNGNLIGTYVTGEIGYGELAALMAGQSQEDLSAGHTININTAEEHKTLQKQKVLETTALQGGRVKGVDFSLYSHEIVGMTGLLGSGYEDIPYLLCGAEHTKTGHTILMDKDLSKCNPSIFASSGATFLPGDRQQTSGVPTATVRENMTLGWLKPFVNLGVLRRRKERRVVRAMMSRLKVRPQNPERPLNQFSGGQQQKTLIGRCLLRSSKLYVIDEPCTGIDVGARNEIHATLKNLSRNGAAVLLTSCQYEELPMICDRVIVFQNGYIVGELKGPEVTEEAILRLCYMDTAKSAP